MPPVVLLSRRMSCVFGGIRGTFYSMAPAHPADERGGYRIGGASGEGRVACGWGRDSRRYPARRQTRWAPGRRPFHFRRGSRVADCRLDACKAWCIKELGLAPRRRNAGKREGRKSRRQVGSNTLVSRRRRPCLLPSSPLFVSFGCHDRERWGKPHPTADANSCKPLPGKKLQFSVTSVPLW